MISFTINDRELEAEEGQTILEVALKEGIPIPTLCYHKELTAYGACRVCLVEIVAGSRPGLEASCIFKVTEGLVVKTDTERVKRARRVVFELLMARCPESEIIRELAAEWGVTETRITLKKKENCILCGLCVRACAEVSQRWSLGFSGRGATRTVNTPLRKVAPTCIGCGACAHLCPTRRITIEAADQ